MRTPLRAEQIQLEVGGHAAGFVRSFRGLDLEAEIATGGIGDMPGKHVAGVRWTPGVAEVGGDMGPGLQGWITEALANGLATRDGSVAALDARGAASWSLAFADARLSAVTIPALDGASKDAAALTVEFVPGQVAWEDRGRAAAPVPQKSAGWLAANFRIEIGDLPCKRVIRVDPFTWTCAADGSVTVPDIRLEIAQTDYAPWRDAARRWFIDGQTTHPMPGRIVLLSPNLRDEVAVIDLGNVGLRRFSRPTTGDDAIGRFAVVLYAERLGFRM
jgi:hypothetical protein